jgi:hypothetical protein
VSQAGREGDKFLLTFQGEGDVTRAGVARGVEEFGDEHVVARHSKVNDVNRL